MIELFANPTFWGWVYVASEWAIRLTMLVVVPFRRNPEAAKGWLMLIFFLPWPGLILYHLIGRPTLPKWRLFFRGRLPGAVEAGPPRRAPKPPINHPPLPPPPTPPPRVSPRPRP